MPSAVEPLAIVGIGCRLPGGIEAPTALWNALTLARDLVGEIPELRWNHSAFHHPDAAALGMSYSRWAGLVENPDQFDAAFFGITPREAQRLDPQQRWFLEATWRAMEDAGQRVEDLRGRSVGVYVGCSSSDYGEIQRRWHYHADLHTNTGAAVSLIANRVSYAFDWRGPSLVIDTACSSSLVALDIGARALRNGQCEAIVVGGANALFMPEASIGFSKASMLARDGRCKAFDARADGYVRAEGAVALLLRPLERALADGDRIYACLLSTAVNQDGQTPGITVPSGSQQKAMIESAYDGIVDPQWVGGIEAHGTGTPVGDPIEARALGTTLGHGRSPDNALKSAPSKPILVTWSRLRARPAWRNLRCRFTTASYRQIFIFKAAIRKLTSRVSGCRWSLQSRLGRLHRMVGATAGSIPLVLAVPMLMPCWRRHRPAR